LPGKTAILLPGLLNCFKQASLIKVEGTDEAKKVQEKSADVISTGKVSGYRAGCQQGK
jgi:hypothetical protein